MAKTPLEVKLGVVKRGVKELDMYRREAADEARRVAELGGPGADGYRHAAQLLEESREMVATTTDRLQVAAAELERLADAAGEAEAAEAREWVERARGALAQGSSS